MKARAAKRSVEEKQANPRAMSGKKQKPMEGALFDAADAKDLEQDDLLDGGKKDAYKNIRNKLFSNPVGDPEVWRAVGEDLHGVWGWAKREASAWARQWELSMSSFGKGDMRSKPFWMRAGSVAREAMEWAERYAYTDDGRMRSLAARYGVEALRKLADAFNPLSRGGAEGAKEIGYFTQYLDTFNKRMNRYNEVMKPFQGLDLATTAKLTSQIGAKVQSGKYAGNSPLDVAARGNRQDPEGNPRRHWRERWREGGRDKGLLPPAG